jgi:hypothetical protein
LFQFGKGGEAGEQVSLDEEGRFGMASRGHAEIVSIRPAKKSSATLSGWNKFLGSFPRVVALLQPWANFCYAFSVFKLISRGSRGSRLNSIRVKP